MLSLSKLSPSITDMIRFDHSHVLLTFHQYTSSKRPAVKKALADTICSALEIHATLEEEIFYPRMRQLNPALPVLQKSVPEHQEMRRLIGELRACDAASARHDALLLELMRDVLHHVAEEETVLLPEAENALGSERLSELGVKMSKRRLALLKPQAGKIAANTAIGFSGSSTAWIVGAAGVLLAARLFTRKAA
ncbi:hemerythrin domain-containing protein [Janthinobacterium psychrotolerans]|uniref:Hemerythrin HHE cation binding domain-containing protein n=1 Tax=Janthinobacterium psychrotolerans TaxID=1747903 RepID=A0A1A7C5B4_9BURK|nr:hemerythrin domain-containing protein [Janthinobacterium psychrotolerans]OBV39940.1 Hemerythrin HHE cation binding domain-containing protein [Janthinobacterium psychrotolerans]